MQCFVQMFQIEITVSIPLNARRVRREWKFVYCSRSLFNTVLDKVDVKNAICFMNKIEEITLNLIQHANSLSLAVTTDHAVNAGYLSIIAR